MNSSGKERSDFRSAMGFLAPNLLGFLAFTAVPLIFSFAMAFTNWDLRLHSPFRDRPIETPVQFVGLENFRELLLEKSATGETRWNAKFVQYSGNTLFLMIGIAPGIALSLLSAMLLSSPLRSRTLTGTIFMIAGVVSVCSAMLLAALGLGASAVTVLAISLLGGIAILGAAGGTGAYRTLFYLPHVVAGVGTYILWKKLYAPGGPINDALAGPMRLIEKVTLATSAQTGSVDFSLSSILAFILILGAVFVFWRTARWLGRKFCDGELGGFAFCVSLAMLSVSPIVARNWLTTPLATFLLIGCGIAVAAVIVQGVTEKRFRQHKSSDSGTALLVTTTAICGLLAIAGLAVLFHALPQMARSGLEPPNWLSNYHLAKPALLIMGLWSAIGSNTMLLYIAALTNIPQDLYEAADIDGAGRWSRFWNVTWPQLAPTTFFVVILSVIGGLQGGFEMARVMTWGGPDGATTTITYFIFTEGFETGRLSFASAVAWLLFAAVMVVTIVNWRFGNKFVNE